MVERPPENWDSGSASRSLSYSLKMELRRLEREGNGESLYADALRRVLKATSVHDRDAVLQMVEQEIRRLEEGGNDPDQADALRRALSIIEPATRSRRELFSYYLRRMEQEGRGDEPFAHALRRALDSPEGPSVDALFDKSESSGNNNVA